MSTADVIRRRYGGRPYCLYCRRQLTVAGGGISTSATLDHVVPKAMGGKRVVPCCLACNSLKGDMLPGEWAAWTAQRPEWWRLWKSSAVTRSTRRGLPRVYEDGEVVHIVSIAE